MYYKLYILHIFESNIVISTSVKALLNQAVFCAMRQKVFFCLLSFTQTDQESSHTTLYIKRKAPKLEVKVCNANHQVN